MPFLAACSFCPNKLKVPDQAVGACLRCPKCGNYFTVAPAEAAEPVANPRRPLIAPAAPERPAAPVETPPPPEDLPWWVLEAPAAPPPPPPEPPPPPPAVLPPAPPLALPKPPPAS